MTRPDIQSLIERVEQSEGPSVALFVDIWRAIGVDDFETRKRFWRFIDARAWESAALTFVPEGRAMAREYLPCAGWPVRIYLFRDGGLPGADEWPRPTFDGKPTRGGKIGVLSKSEPMALCIAALQARNTDNGK